MMKQAWTIIAASTALGGCLDTDLTEAELATDEQATHSWNGYHWARTANPFALDLADNVATAWDGYLATASADWSESSVLDTTIVAGGARNRSCKPTAGRVEVCAAKQGRNGWLGLATIWLDGVHIVQGTVKLNDTYFATSTYNTTAWRNLVMCQEVGHTLGLDHQDEDFENTPLGSCMDYSDDPVPNQHPDDHDYEELELIYDHVDTTTTIGAASAFGAETSDSPAQWGRRVRVSASGHQAMYVRELGQDRRVVTHVTWAEPR